MKKTFYALLCLTGSLMPFSKAIAQDQSCGIYNKVHMHSVSNNFHSTWAKDIVSTDKPGEVVVLGSFMQQGWQNSDEFVIKKLDGFGNVVWERYLGKTVDSYNLDLRRLIRTNNNTYIAVGYLLTQNGLISNPYAMRFDASGNVIWSRAFLSNTQNVALISPSFNSVDIEKVQDSPPGEKESYLLFATGQPYNPSNNQEAVMNVVRFDINGVPIWNKKFRDVTPPGYIYEDMAQAITYVPESRAGSYYFLTGVRVDVPFNINYNMFQMGIDRNGNVVKQYRYMDVPSYPFNIDAIYNNNTSEIAVTYTHGSSGYFGMPSQVGFMAMDGDMNINLVRFYATQKGNEHYSSRIKATSDGAYVLSSMLLHDENNLSLLKIQTNGTPMWWQKYNIYRFAMTDNIPLDITYCDDESEHYAMAGTVDGMQTSSPTYTMRVLSTDQNGVVCGSVENEILYESYEPNIEYLQYDATTHQGIEDMALYKFSPKAALKECDPSNPNYKPSVVGSIRTEQPITVYPTLATTDAVNIGVTLEAAGTVYIKLYSVTGALINSQEIKTQAGATTLQADMSKAVPGSYILHVEHSGGKQTSRTRIQKL